MVKSTFRSLATIVGTLVMSTTFFASGRPAVADSKGNRGLITSGGNVKPEAPSSSGAAPGDFSRRAPEAADDLLNPNPKRLHSSLLGPSELKIFSSLVLDPKTHKVALSDHQLAAASRFMLEAEITIETDSALRQLDEIEKHAAMRDGALEGMTRAEKFRAEKAAEDRKAIHDRRREDRIAEIYLNEADDQSLGVTADEPTAVKSVPEAPVNWFSVIKRIAELELAQTGLGQSSQEIHLKVAHLQADLQTYNDIVENAHLTAPDRHVLEVAPSLIYQHTIIKRKFAILQSIANSIGPDHPGTISLIDSLGRHEMGDVEASWDEIWQRYYESRVPTSLPRAPYRGSAPISDRTV